MGNGPPLRRRHSEQSKRMANQDLSLSTEPLIDGRPKISSLPQDSTAYATAVNTGPTGPPSFSRIPMTYHALRPLPATQPIPRPLVGDGPSPPNPRHYPAHPLASYPRDYPPFGMQDLPLHPLPPPEQRGYIHRAPLPFWPKTSVKDFPRVGTNTN